MRVSFLWQLTLTALIISGCVRDTGLIDAPSKKLPEKCLETAAPAKDNEGVGAVAEIKDSPSIPLPPPPPPAADIAAESTTPRYNVNEVAMPPPDHNRFLDNNCFVIRWNILGPFPFDPAEYASGNLNTVLHHEFVPDEKMLDGNQPPPAGTSWQLVRFMPQNSLGQINLARLFENQSEHAAAYAVTYLYCEKPENNLILYVGGTGFLKIWINHRLVHAYNREPRESRWDQDAVHGIKLDKGYNLVVVKTVTVGLHWDFFFRLASENNAPLKFLPR